MNSQCLPPVSRVQSLTDKYRQEICLLSSLVEYHKNNNNHTTNTNNTVYNHGNSSDERISSSICDLSSVSEQPLVLPADTCNNSTYANSNKRMLNDNVMSVIPNPISLSSSIPLTVSQNILSRHGCYHPGYLSFNCVKQVVKDVETVLSTSKTATTTTTFSLDEKSPYNNSTNKMDFDVYVPICYQCGGPLQPGILDCTIRIHSNSTSNRSKIVSSNNTTTTSTDTTCSKSKKNNKRTIRRRMLRVKAKLVKQIEQEQYNDRKQNKIQHHQKQQLQRQSSSSSNTIGQDLITKDKGMVNLLSFCNISSTSLSLSIHKYEQSHQRYTNRLLYKNHCIITCGVCFAQRILPGIPIIDSTTKTSQQTMSSPVTNNKQKQSFYHLLSNGKNQKTTNTKQRQKRQDDHEELVQLNSTSTSICTSVTPRRKNNDDDDVKTNTSVSVIHLDQTENNIQGITPSNNNSVDNNPSTMLQVNNDTAVGTEAVTPHRMIQKIPTTSTNHHHLKTASTTKKAMSFTTTKTTASSSPYSTSLHQLATSTRKKKRKSKDPLKDFLLTLNDR